MCKDLKRRKLEQNKTIPKKLGRRAALLTGLWAAIAWMSAACIEGTGNYQDVGDTTQNRNERAYDEGYKLSSVGYDGVDLLVVIDNSGSMSEEQQLLATQFFPLINRLTGQEQGDFDGTFPAAQNLKVAVVTSDMGLQVGENGETNQVPQQVASCLNPVGDNGGFMSIRSDTTEISIDDGVVQCAQSADQCPPGFECADDELCYSIDKTGHVDCPKDDASVFSTSVAAPDKEIAVESACLAFQGTAGCGFEQTLEAMVRGLEVHPGFVEERHVLAVIVVSDEEDCSIEDPGLFTTTAWNTPQLQNTACNVPEGETYLFEPKRYHDKLTALKKGLDEALVFSAIVGVPVDGDETCEGTGIELVASGCLERDDMQLSPMEFRDLMGNSYIHFSPACTRKDSLDGHVITEARPGHRFVKVAEYFGGNGLVHSICREDWSGALNETGEEIAKKLSHPCLPYRAAWRDFGDGNGMVDETCDLFIEYKGSMEEMQNFECPDALFAELNREDRAALRAKTIIEPNADKTETDIYCAVPKIKAPKSCESLEKAKDLSASIGWTYCENDGRCDYRVDATAAVREIAAGHFFAYRCMVP